MIKGIRLSIRVKLLITLLISLVLAALVFYCVFEFGNFLVWRYYLGEASKQERAEKYIAEFQEYVKDNQLTIDDTDMISSWDGGYYIDLIVYKDANLIYSPEWFEDFKDDKTETEAESEILTADGETELSSEATSESAPENSSESEKEGEESGEGESEAVTDKSFYESWFSGDRGFEQYLTEEARKDYRAALDDALAENRALRPVYFVDGTLLITVVDFTDEALGNLVFALSIIAALAVVAGIMIGYFGKITNRIRALAKNVRIIEEGDLDHKISESGKDEISVLASDVGSMRDAIVDNMTRERRAWEANAGLITAMSHDIRTPLTVLLGYLDLIEMQNNGEISEEYISACRENAMRLKNLSDDMFSYFLVFGKSENGIELVEVDAGELISHVIQEYEILLAEKGYTFESFGNIQKAYVRIDERYLRRVIDNIFSNIMKYADIGHPVCLGAVCGEDSITLSCKNKIRTDKDIPESNGIGLKTCAKMMEEMGGKISYEEKDGMFTASMTLPLEKKNDRTDT